MDSSIEILNGSYKSIPISINSASLNGGRKVAIRQFPNRDTQTVIDLGLQPRQYSLQIIISAKRQKDYFGYRNDLLAVLESNTPGELIHPLYGRLNNVVAASYSLSEDFSSFGDSSIDVNFEVNNNTGIPQASSNALPQVSILNDDIIDLVAAGIIDSFKVTSSFIGNFTAAVAKVNDIVSAVRGATSFIGEVAQELNAFSDEIGALSANVNGLVSDPIALSLSITSIFQSVNGLYASSSATLETFVGFFDFGSNDVDISLNTVSRVERDRNNQTLNEAIAATSLGYSYLAVVQIDFQTDRQIDDTINRLDAKYDSILDNVISQEIVDAVTLMRIKVLEVLNQVRVSTSKIIPINTNLTTARVLGFSYYGNDLHGDEIVTLNNLSDVSFVEGPLEILSA